MEELSDGAIVVFAILAMGAATVVALAGWELATLITTWRRR